MTARDREERGEFTRDGRGADGKPRQGHTIYVFGYNISEELLKKSFSTYGNIVNVNMEIEKKYVTEIHSIFEYNDVLSELILFDIRWV